MTSDQKERFSIRRDNKKRFVALAKLVDVFFEYTISNRTIKNSIDFANGNADAGQRVHVHLADCLGFMPAKTLV